MTSEDFFNKLSLHFNKNLPFVAYRKPNDNKIYALLQKDNNLNSITDFSECGFVFTPFNNIDESVIIPIDASERLQLDGFEAQDESLLRNSSNINNINARENHIKLVQKGIDAINDSQFQKVVLSRLETENFEENEPFELFKRLLTNYNSAFVYIWYHPKVGCWLGATPETLLKIEGKRVTTMSLAGTQNYSETLDVIWDKKEKVEQQYVTDFVIDGLKSSSVDSIKISDTQTIQAGNLLHLQTTISGLLKTSNLKDVIEALHPTPAVCGLPREAAKNFILKNESYNRAYYTGFLGELNLKETKTRNTNRRNVENSAYSTVNKVSNLFVNLRCMQLQDRKALIYVGGGITQDSVPEKEWEETVFKSIVMKKVLKCSK